ncbi:hypothetical protein [Lentzea sp. HUAS12]|uniref:hypothetical protein n=1 Tax=Lentzea sp. HUAS12 TaxID=2951806 RepID=UPI00209D34B9|nr:hypothetical protein [Lentzea sp. HUAS12]USX55631.1 hypothetical protein ND450_16455 [Lentzea sp. HUAS12]
MNTRFADPDYQLLWPRDLFARAATSLINRRELEDWDERCELLLEDAFVGGFGGPVTEFREISAGIDKWGNRPAGTAPHLTLRQNFLLGLVRSADQLREDNSQRRQYWSRRKTGVKVESANLSATAYAFVELVGELDDKGYFDRRFGKDCVDDPRGGGPSSMIERAIGVSGAWPLKPMALAIDLDLFCDIVEVLHDLVARPTSRTRHGFSDCGWHHGDFAIEFGRAIYRWRVNQLLKRSDLGLRLADGGEDIGYMVVVTEDSRDELVKAVLAEPGDTGDQVGHAVALFRKRGADRNDKRSAVTSLARILESKRKLLKAELLSKDEDALFMIANKFDIRHQNEAQQPDYDEIFLDWVFWWYLATIELAAKVAARDQVAAGA